MSPVVVIGLTNGIGQDAVVAAPPEVVQSNEDVPDTVLDVSNDPPLPWRVAAINWLLLFEARACADVGTTAPLTLTTVTADVPEVVASPVRLPLVIVNPPLKNVSSPLAGLPVVVTVPEPALIELHPRVWVDVLYVRALIGPAQPLVPVVGIATAVGVVVAPLWFINTVSAF